MQMKISISINSSKNFNVENYNKTICFESSTIKDTIRSKSFFMYMYSCNQKRLLYIKKISYNLDL